MKKSSTSFILWCSAVYFASYMTRLNYAASIAEIIRDMRLTKEAASIAVTGAFITYGGGQLLSGVLGDRVSPRLLIPMGLTGAAVCNVFMTVSPDIAIMTVIWCVNGVFQSMLWPPLTRAMSDKLTRSDYRTGSSVVSAAASISTVVIYLAVPLCIRASGWRLFFRIAAAFAALVGAGWFLAYPRFPEKVADGAEDGGTRAAGTPSPVMMALICGAVVLQGLVKDGVLTWMPSCLAEYFQLENTDSIMTTAVLPVFSVLCIFGATVLQRFVPNELVCSVICFSAASLAGLLLNLFPGGAFPTVLELAVMSGMMYAVNLFLISRVPGWFGGTGRVSRVAGLVNFFTYVGSAVSAFGVAILADLFGWRTAELAWLAAVVMGAALCALALPGWRKFTSERE